MLSTPGGTTSATAEASARVLSGVYGEGLPTTVFPVSSAGASFTAIMLTGKFQGAMQALTPIGRRSSVTRARSSSRNSSGLGSGSAALRLSA
jgi:hypothetical protein